MILELKRIESPKFTANAFTATAFASAEEKANFANRLCAFISSDFKPNLFTEKLYARLHLCFGHIAHYDRHGFQAEFFGSLTGKIKFLKQTLEWTAYGGPTYTYCDVERAIQKRLRHAGILEIYQTASRAQIESAERQLLRALREKYADNGAPQQIVIAVGPARIKPKPAEPVVQTALF